MIIHLKIFVAFLFGNGGGKRNDVHGRTYRSTYRKFGHKKMYNEYLSGNTWKV